MSFHEILLRLCRFLLDFSVFPTSPFTNPDKSTEGAELEEEEEVGATEVAGMEAFAEVVSTIGLFLVGLEFVGGNLVAIVVYSKYQVSINILI
jgi:hypothetical protein